MSSNPVLGLLLILLRCGDLSLSREAKSIILVVSYPYTGLIFAAQPRRKESGYFALDSLSSRIGIAAL